MGMGFVKDAKADMVAKDARKALDAGRAVFAARLNMPSSQAGGMSGAIDDWGVMIEAIEAEGWALTHWSTASDAKGRAEAHPVFRRRTL